MVRHFSHYEQDPTVLLEAGGFSRVASYSQSSTTPGDLRDVDDFNVNLTEARKKNWDYQKIAWSNIVDLFVRKPTEEK